MVWPFSQRFLRVVHIKKIISSKHIKYWHFLLMIPVFFLIRYYYLHDPEVGPTNGGTEGLFPRCYFNALTGYHCPGCGSQRAVHDLLHFRIFEALSHNVTIVLVALVLGAKAYAVMSKKYFLKYHYNLGQKSFFTITIIVILFAYWILRNIPVAPFTSLAP